MLPPQQPSGRNAPEMIFLQHADFARFGNSILEPALERRTGFPSTPGLCNAS